MTSTPLPEQEGFNERLERMQRSKTVEVPIAWFKGLLERLDEYQQADESIAQDIALSKLEGYISSADAIIQRGANQ